MKLFHSIRSRLSFITGFFLIAAVILACGICIVIYKSLLDDKITDTAFTELGDVGENIWMSVNQTQDLGATLSRLIRVEAASGTLSPEKLRRWANVMAANPNVAACGIFLGKDTVCPEGLTKFEWYTRARAEGIGIWDRQYIDTNMPLDSGAVILATYVLPLLDNEMQRMGDAVLMVSHRYLASIVNNASMTAHSFHMLVNEGGKVLATSDSVRCNARTLEEFLAQHGCDNPEHVIGIMRSTPRCIFDGNVGDQDGWFCYKTIPNCNWQVISFIPKTDIYSPEFMLKFIFIVLGVLALLIVSIVFTRVLIRRNLEPLSMMSDAAKAVAGGDFNHPLPSVGDNEELQALVSSFDKMRHDIVHHIDQEKESAVLRERIENELRIAQNIQFEMLPPVDVEHPYPQHHDFYALMQTAREVGGDLYHYHYVDHKLLFSIGDVSGKGVPSAIYMSQIITQLRYISITSEKEHTFNLGMINKSVCEENTYHMFSTLMLVSLDLHTGELTTCNAGHESPIIIDPQGHVSQLITDTNIPIGLMSDYVFTKQSDYIEPGSVIFCFSDGVTEAMNEQGELYGVERLCEVLAGCNKLSPKEIVGLVEKNIADFVGKAERSDDITMFVVSYKG